MFEFIKKFFQEEQQEEDFSLKEFEAWFEEYSNKSLKKALDIIEKFNKKVETGITETRKKAEHLKNSELKNSNIPERAMQLLKGNRESHINKVTNFLENIKIPRNIGDVKESLQKFEGDLEVLTKSTQKSYMILQEFLANETRDMTVSVNQIRDILKELNEKLKKENVKLVREIKKELENIKNSENLKRNMKKDLTEKQEEEDRLTDAYKDIKNKIKSLEKSDDFISLEDLKNKKQKIVEKIEVVEKNGFHIFAVLEKSLKKYQRMTLNEELVKKYLENPIRALIHDDDFKIIEILRKMKETIEKGDLQLVDKKKEKTIKMLNSITKEFISNFKGDYLKLKKELQDLVDKINEIKVAEEIETLKLEEISLEKIINRTKQELEELNKRLGDIDIKKIIGKIAERASELTGKEVKIHQ